MALIFKIPIISENDDWVIKKLTIQISTEEVCRFTAQVLHKKNNLMSHVFTVDHNIRFGTFHISCGNFGWSPVITIPTPNPPKSDPIKIIKACLEKPICVAVMYRVRTKRATQIIDMNKFFGYKMFKSTSE